MGINGSVFETSWGWCGVAISDLGIAALILPKGSREEAISNLKARAKGVELGEGPAFERIVEGLRRYFLGFHVDLGEYRLDLSPLSPFASDVLLAVREIPLGETRSYKWVACSVGNPKASRAVGRVLASNPIPIIIPCHRVIGSDGSLVGFSEGVGMKAKLLEHERAMRSGNPYLSLNAKGTPQFSGNVRELNRG